MSGVDRAGYVPTPGLRDVVLKLVDRALEAGYVLQPGIYVSATKCCAVGAISIGVKNLGPDEMDSAMQAAGRGRAETFMIAMGELNCNPLELDSIEAGFECWDWGHFICETPSGQALERGFLDLEAFAIGRWVREKYADTATDFDEVAQLLNRDVYEHYLEHHDCDPHCECAESELAESP